MTFTRIAEECTPCYGGLLSSVSDVCSDKIGLSVDSGAWVTKAEVTGLPKMEVKSYGSLGKLML